MKTIEYHKECIEALKNEKRRYFKDKHKKILMVCDIMFIMSFIFNIGALVITNALVVKNHPDVQLYEANPVARDSLNYAEPPDDVSETDGRKVSDRFRGMLIQFIVYSFLIIGYLTTRYFLDSDYKVISLLALTLVFFYMMTFDVAGNFGYWLGMMIYG